MTIERAKPKSKQPRFTDTTETTWFSSFAPFTRLAEIEAPAYLPNSRMRDAWLRTAWKLEPHLAGVMNAVTLIDANRGWELTGGRNLVHKYTDVLHMAEGGDGWRTFMRKASLAYWASDIGCIVEVGRDGRNGPLRGLWSVDSARCQLTGNADLPLRYFPMRGNMQNWAPGDFLRVASMPSEDESYHGLGFCALSRATELMRLMYAVMLHDQEKVAARAPKGLLLLQGISEQQWEDSLKAREERLDSMERRYYGGVQVLANSGMDTISATLVGLSQLPDNFDAKTFVDLTMYGYALAFGYDPSEFWPVQFGALGRGNESEVQHQKATGKGGLDFVLHFQERLQGELPETVQWGFEQRDDAGELAEIAVKQAWMDFATRGYEAGILAGMPLLNRQQALSLLAEANVIPPEWTVTEEDTTATDTEDAGEEATADEIPDDEQASAPPEPAPEPTPPAERDRILSQRNVRRAMDAGETIVRYRWPERTEHTLWQPRKVWRGHRVTRAADDVLYSGGDVTITKGDVDKAIAEGRKRLGEDYAALLEAKPVTKGG
jgi:hypothetical protein